MKHKLERSSMSAKNRLLTYLKAKRGALVLALVFSLLFVVSQIAQPFLLGRALDASKKITIKLLIFMFSWL